ncbi:N-formylglutamate amidohydrolase [Qipengyuania spongiae]|uniref:N-formylglutamate amidohydrolase n=1 Tax=Qipengyuania spongiae TaxID=2909673 RepID=A0ABY5SVQ2_9SPHN|nr:N-formylglutamate amidohydrolase [Qipengyuania spongiae]UVI38638.1 N-formylglutamate amidohydrolase [Qipengyuania spongiae]
MSGISNLAGPDGTGIPGGRVPGMQRPAFRFHPGRAPMLPVVVAVPHAGRDYPAEVLEEMREPDWSRLRLEDRHVDLIGREIARMTGVPLLVAEAPRALIDLNRSPDDMDWTMVSGDRPAKPRGSLVNRRARSGLGLVPRRLHGLGEIWKGRLAQSDLSVRIENIHRPYHRTLGKALEDIRDAWGAALLIDLHSMPPLKPNGANLKPAEFVIGDRFGASSDTGVSARALEYLEGAGRRTAHNRPYSGGYVLDTHGAPRRNIHALQIEVCRTTYLDTRLAEPGPRLGSVARLLAGLVRQLAEVVARMGEDTRDGGGLAMAAE